MSTIALGPLRMRSDLVVFFLAAAFGYLILRLRLRGREGHAETADLLVNSMLLGLLVWKFSMLLFNPLDTLAHPLSLLYFTGGKRGIWLALVVASGYIGRQLKHNPTLMKPLIKGGSIAYLSYRLAEAAILWGIEGTAGMSRPIGLLLFATLAGWAWHRFDAPLRSFLNVGIWYFIGSVLLEYLHPYREVSLAGLSVHQILFALIAIGFVLLDSFLTERERRRPANRYRPEEEKDA
ncbi:hypothetical protein [Gorillibacterium sp. sgz500922]|uniref:hypothetical protein n=1 Tax=Gorillibacterium sp. sgz500922 TaxID=3446694 RepID=UPI003F664283